MFFVRSTGPCLSLLFLMIVLTWNCSATKFLHCSDKISTLKLYREVYKNKIDMNLKDDGFTKVELPSTDNLGN